MGPIANNPASNRVVGGDEILVVVELEISCPVAAVDADLREN